MNPICRVTAELRAEGLRQDDAQRKYQLAYDVALKQLNNGQFDSETVKEAMTSQGSDWWVTLVDELTIDPAAAGVKIREAVFEQLVQSAIEDMDIG